MSGAKLDLARRAVETAVERLLPTDRFAVVAYDDRIDVVVESTPASREAKTMAVDRLRTIDARGSTNLGEGWLRGAEQVARAQAAASGSSVNRVLVLTDGLANLGMTDPGELTRHAAELRVRGITTTTFGVGEDFDESLLQSMADAGGGHFYFIADAAQIIDQIASEVGELLEVVARDATIEVTAPDGMGVAVDSLSRFPVEARGNRWLVRLGDLDRRAAPGGRAPGPVRLRRDRPGGRRPHRRQRSRWRARGCRVRPGARRLAVRRRPDERRPAPRPVGGSARGAPVRGASAAGGGAAQPPRELRRGAPFRAIGRSAHRRVRGR